MKRPVMAGIISIGIVLAFALLSTAEEKPSSQIIRAAQQGIAVFLNSSKNMGLHKMGFTTEQAIQDSVLGEAFQVFTVPPEKLLNGQPVRNFQSLSVPLNQWQFIITSRQVPKALLMVELLNNVWTPVSLGSAGLARELSHITSAWPASQGYRYKLIRVYQARSELIELSMGNKVMGTLPMTSLRVAVDGRSEKFDPLDLRDPEEIIRSLRHVVRNNLKLEK